MASRAGRAAPHAPSAGVPCAPGGGAPRGCRGRVRRGPLLLAGDGVVLVPTSSSNRLESRGGDLKLVVVVGTRLGESAAPEGSEHAVPVGGDEKAGRDGDEVWQEQPTGEEQQQGQPEVAGEEVDVQTIVAAALARFTAAASPPPTTEALEEEDQRRRSEEANRHGAGRGAGVHGGEGGT